MDIVAERLSHVYGSGTPFEKEALYELNFRIPSGSFTGIIGHTGSGKSTLIQHFNGLLRPTSGKLYVGDFVLTAESKKTHRLRQQIGMAFQYPEHQLFEETVARDVAFGPRNLHLEPNVIEQRVRTALDQVGLDYERVAGSSPFQLSGGQMRRVALAGVLAMEPRVLVLDEPTAGLDPQGKKDIIRTILHLKQTRKLTVVYVSHSMEEIARLADHLLVLHEGRVVMEGSPDGVFARERELRQFGLDIPNVLHWIQELNQFIDPPIPRKLYTVEQLADVIAQSWFERKRGL